MVTKDAYSPPTDLMH